MNHETGSTGAALFPDIRFPGSLRPSQLDVAEIASRKLRQGASRLHIVAPPGAGKTVIGLYLWAEIVRRPALVLSPNSAIQAQWLARTDLFECDRRLEDLISSDPQSPGLLNSLTYQSVTLPSRSHDGIDALALELWAQRLVDQEHAADLTAAQFWVEDLRRHSRDYYDKRFSSWKRIAREQTALAGDSLSLLHPSSLETLTRLRDADVGLIILDECHHLMGHWGRVLAEACDLLNGPIVIGLTATPPDESGQRPEDVARYAEFFGPIDYEVPVPAVVRDGFLAPYQDLAWFVRPTPREMDFIAGVDDEFHRLISDLSSPRPDAPGDGTAAESLPPLSDWIFGTLDSQTIGSFTANSWNAFERRDPDFALAARQFLTAREIGLPEHVPPLPGGVLQMLGLRRQRHESLDAETLTTLIDRYVRHGLRRSSLPEDQQRCRTAIDRLRLLGVQITEVGSQPCASPISRVLAYTGAKAGAAIPILHEEMRNLGDDIRVVVITDYEKTSAVSAEIAHLLDDEAGGAIAAFRMLLSDAETNRLNPILLTGSTVLTDSDNAEAIDRAATAWLRDHGHNVVLSFGEEDGFHVVSGSGADWCPRVYVRMMTDLFQDGVTRCLVGTRGLLGEGWDANSINVLLDLTTITTSMSVNQLRGRSIRLNPKQPNKLANNWDVVCIAPEFARGLDDYRRFCRKHKTIFGVTDDGAIEKGVGHVHAALTELEPEGLEQSVTAINADMLRRAGNRAAARELWNIGKPYAGTPIRAIESLQTAGTGDGCFPTATSGQRVAWSPSSLSLAIGNALIHALHELGLLKSVADVQANERQGGYVRMFLEDAEETDSQLFANCLNELLGPFQQPRYLVPRHVDQKTATLLSKLLPGFLGDFFEKTVRQLVMWHAVPKCLSRNKHDVSVFQKHWNRHVSSGDAVYVHRGSGKTQLEAIRRQGQMPALEPHTKDVFL